MSGSLTFRLDLGPDFGSSISKFQREHYKKDDQGAGEFRAVLADSIKALYDFPTVAGSGQERFPDAAKPHCAGWEMHKLEFTVPRQAGKSRQGRLVYMAHRQDKVLVVLYVYSHRQFELRIPDRPLAQLVRAVTGELAVTKADKK